MQENIPVDYFLLQLERGRTPDLGQFNKAALSLRSSSEEACNKLNVQFKAIADGILKQACWTLHPRSACGNFWQFKENEEFSL